MNALLIAAQDEATHGFDWSILVVPVIAGSVAIVVAIYNTRGETASLRRLKAMNEVIEKLPKDSDVVSAFIAARDLQAQRVAVRLSDRRVLWRKLPIWLFGLLVAALMTLVVVVLLMVFPPVVSGWELVGNVSIVVVATAAAVTTAVRGLADAAEARRRFAARASSAQP